MAIIDAYLLNKETRHSLQLRVREARAEAIRLAKMLTEEEIAQLSVLDQYNVRKLVKPKMPRIKKRTVFKDTSPDLDLPWLKETKAT